MKKFTMVVHESVQQQLADCLRSLQLDTFIFSHVEEHSAQLEHDAFLSARDKVVGYVPQVRVDVIVDDARAPGLLGEIRETGCNFKGRGIYWISNLDDSGEL